MLDAASTLLQELDERGTRHTTNAASNTRAEHRTRTPSSATELARITLELEERTADLEVAAQLGEALLSENERLRGEGGDRQRERNSADAGAAKRIKRLTSFLEESEQSNAALTKDVARLEGEADGQKREATAARSRAKRTIHQIM